MALQIPLTGTMAKSAAGLFTFGRVRRQPRHWSWKPERADVVRLAIVLALALLIRTWIIGHTEVTARDSIGFMRFALNLQENSWPEVIRSYEQAPGYPTLILAVLKPVRLFTGSLTCNTLVLSAQLASLLASILTIFPLYFLGKSLFDRDAGAVSAALWQCLPVCVQVTSDGLSEATFLLLVTWTLSLAVSAIRKPTVFRYILCGVGTGFAYWTRPEGMELFVAIAAVLLITGIIARNWRSTVLRLVGLVSGVAPFVALYVGITGHLSNKPTARELLHGNDSEAILCRANPSGSTSPILLGKFSNNDLIEEPRTIWALKSLGQETAKAFHYLGTGLAVTGLWWFRRSLWSDTRLWLLLLLAALHAAILWRMAFVKGYVSERHTMLIVLIGSLWIGTLIADVGRRISTRSWMRWAGSHGATIAMVAIVSCFGIPNSLKPLHANRAGHHAAGCWLAHNMSAQDEVVDPFCWAHFYSGSVFREGHDATPSPEIRTRYIVIEQGENQHGRLPLMGLARELAAKGERVYSWPENVAPEKAIVVVYKVPEKRSRSAAE